MHATDQDDIASNESGNTHFNDIVRAALSRRGFLKAGLGLGATTFLSGSLAACGSDDDDYTGPAVNPPAKPGISFKAVPFSTGDSIVVPEGYSSHVFCSWGDPLIKGAPVWKGDASEGSAAQALQFGDNHDGMHFFPIDGVSSTEGLMACNHEYINIEYFFAKGIVPGGAGWTADHVAKSQNAQGVSVAHVKLNTTSKRWEVVVDSKYNRSINANTLTAMTGPAAGHPLLQTTRDPLGKSAYGTYGNCGNGFTPWGTYLTCEENFVDYFGTTNAAPPATNEQMKRYGVGAGASSATYRWETFDARFDRVTEPNEMNRFGWIVEIDPFDPSSTPKKLTALGHIKHENAALTFAADNRVVVYMGDDQVNEYVYKFVSDGKFDKSAPQLNRGLLDSGKLYVAQFKAGEKAGDFMGDGVWIPLDLATPTTAGGKLGDTFGSQAEILIRTRQAADAVGATPMDRPEWVTTHPETKEVYVTLTNNSARAAGKTDDANPRVANQYGQIIRWKETGGDPAALTFKWDLFLLAGNPVAHPDRAAADLLSGSANITADNTFNSPDGLAFDSAGRLWIQTDGKYTNKGDFASQGNNQMLIADPVTKEIRRFMVGPSACEVTGITFTPDLKYVFVNIQHPGEYGSGHPNETATKPVDNPLTLSSWPDPKGGRPRPSTVVIWKNDGGIVGT